LIRAAGALASLRDRFVPGLEPSFNICGPLHSAGAKLTELTAAAGGAACYVRAIAD
jgi:hypothetical protein